MDPTIVIAVISMVVSVITLINSIYLQLYLSRKKATVEAFNTLQNEVLDKLVFDKKGNAELIVKNLNNADCIKAYNDYRTLLARLEHFSIGVNQRIYSFKVVKMLAGAHLVSLFQKVKPIIDKSNEHFPDNHNFREFVKLIGRLKNERKK